MFILKLFFSNTTKNLVKTQLDKSIKKEKNTLQDFLSFPDVTASVINVNIVYKAVKQTFIVIVKPKQFDF